MKVNLVKKFKWYIVGFIMSVILLSAGLSFCTWDYLSIQALKAKANTGGYFYMHPLNDYVTLVVDDNGNKFADVGDIVQYGRYWQDTGATGVEGLKPQRWIVVNIDEQNIATLLAEQVVVYGNFWGKGQYYQNYYQSTLRAWLNSGRDSVSADGTIGNVATKAGDENWRDDGVGSAFNSANDNGHQANGGFLDVAFDDTERSILVPKKIFGIQGHAKGTDVGGISEYSIRNNANVKSINDLVWVPSYKEIYGNIKYYGVEVLDGVPSEQFQYFAAADKTVTAYYNIIPAAIAEATDYAYEVDSYDKIASYYNNGVGGRNGNKNITNGNGTWWWLRSPYPTIFNFSLVVNTGGQCSGAYTYDTSGGVRPAVCVQL